MEYQSYQSINKEYQRNKHSKECNTKDYRVNKGTKEGKGIRDKGLQRKKGKGKRKEGRNKEPEQSWEQRTRNKEPRQSKAGSEKEQRTR